MICAQNAPEQAVILVGGLGTRLGALTADLPKPLLQVGGRPFLDYLVDSCTRFGFRDLLLLAGYKAEQVARYAEEKQQKMGQEVRIHVNIESTPRGTAGAVRHARHLLADKFLLLNGDSFFDINWLDLPLLLHKDGTKLAIALCHSSEAIRFGAVKSYGDQIVGFAERGGDKPGLINTGIYAMHSRVVAEFPDSGSLEQIVLPELVSRNCVRGRTYEGFFIDIGVASALNAAKSLLPARLRRPAVFFDRDGTLVADSGYVHRLQDLVFLPGAVAAVKRVNDLGRYAFLVTNQAGVAHGRFTEKNVQQFNAEVQRFLRAAGAHFDDVRYCPYHPNAKVEAYRCSSDWRKPAPGMLLDLLRSWPIIRESSFAIGNSELDVRAAEAAGLRGYVYREGNLDAFLESRLETNASVTLRELEHRR